MVGNVNDSDLTPVKNLRPGQVNEMFAFTYDVLTGLGISSQIHCLQIIENHTPQQLS